MVDSRSADLAPLQRFIAAAREIKPAGVQSMGGIDKGLRCSGDGDRNGGYAGLAGVESAAAGHKGKRAGIKISRLR